MPGLVVDVDHADQFSVADQRHGEKRLVRIFLQLLETLETRIGGGVGAESDDAHILSHPSRDAFAHLQSDVADFLGMGQLRCPEYDLLAASVYQIHQTGVTASYLDRQTNQFLEHLLQREIGTDDVADLVQQLDLALAFHYRHAFPLLTTSSVRSGFGSSPIQSFYVRYQGTVERSHARYQGAKGLRRSVARKAIHQNPRQIGNQDGAHVVGGVIDLRHAVDRDRHGDASAFCIDQGDVGAQGIESPGFIGDGDTAEAAAHAGIVVAAFEDGEDFLGMLRG